MNRFHSAFLPLLLLVLAGCTTSKQKSAEVHQGKVGATEITSFSPIPAGATVEPIIPAEVQKLNKTQVEPAVAAPDAYSLQHRVFPDLLFKTEGQFFASLHGGEFERLREIIAENYGAAYSKAMRMKSVSQPDIVFITFPEPARAPLCYHVALIKKDTTFTYLALEKSDDLLGTGIKSAFCGWTADGSHVNYGDRTYTSLTDFEEEVRAFLARQGSPQPSASTTPR
ncbi:MAG: hypothetical protein QM715_04525 [Nibricoccus sp.]